MPPKLTEEEILEFKEFAKVSLMKHRSTYKKLERIRQDFVSQLGEILPAEISKKRRKPLWENQLGIGIDDEGLEIRIRLNSRSQVEYPILRRDWEGNITVKLENDHLGIIDDTRRVLTELLGGF